MSKANNLGGGLTREIVGERLRNADTQRKIQAKFDSIAAAAAPAVAAAPVPQRKALTLKPKMPGISKKVAAAPSDAGAKRKLVMKVAIKSPALRRTLGIKAGA